MISRSLRRSTFASLMALMACGSSEIGGPPLSQIDAGSDASTPLPDAGAHPLCVDGKSAGGAYPKADYAVALLGTLPDLVFDSALPDGTPGKVSLHDYYEPCAERSRLLVLRVSAAWCGTCRWNVAHTGAVTKLDVGPRLSLVDLLLTGVDGVTATLSDLTAWRARIDTPQQLAIDRKFPLGAVSPLPSRSSSWSTRAR